MKAIAPGKLILSGEHAVVHGKPALVMAVDRHVYATVEPTDDDVIRVAFPGVFGADAMPTAALPGFKSRVLNNYNRFLTGQLGIRHVLGSPMELLFYAVIHVLDETASTLKGGVNISLKTDLPVGCGMGSSAAVIAAVIGGVAALLKIPTDKDALYRWTLDAEKLQHGHPSGVDPFITVHGGFVRFQQGEARALAPLRAPMHLALTGVPESTTGECVAQVSHAYPMNDPIWAQFERITDELESALHRGEHDDVRSAVRANHRLLTRIGVVPDRVRTFIEEIEAAGGAAKVCGAGAVTGHAGGVVLIVDGHQMEEVCRRHGHELFPVHTDTVGLDVKKA